MSQYKECEHNISDIPVYNTNTSFLIQCLLLSAWDFKSILRVSKIIHRSLVELLPYQTLIADFLPDIKVIVLRNIFIIYILNV